jgi:putative AlgH/UPF0301 family transcriptional regulator
LARPSWIRIIAIRSTRGFRGLVAWRPGKLQAEFELGAWLVLELDAALN